MAVSIKQLKGEFTDRDVFLQDLLNAIQIKFDLIFDKKYDDLWADYESALYRKDKARMFKEPGGKAFMGIIRGVSKQGMLLIEKEDASIEKYNFKEVIYL